MRKFALCTVLLLIGIPLFAGLSINATGGAELLIHEGDIESEIYPVVGVTANYSIPQMPISVRAGVEYGWKPKTVTIEGDEYDINTTLITALLALQYNIAIPGAPASFYIGGGPEILMLNADEVFVEGTKYSIDYNEVGALVYAGGSVNIGTISLFAEAGFGMLFEEGAPKHVPVRGGIQINL